MYLNAKMTGNSLSGVGTRTAGYCTDAFAGFLMLCNGETLSNRWNASLSEGVAATDQLEKVGNRIISNPLNKNRTGFQ